MSNLSTLGALYRYVALWSVSDSTFLCCRRSKWALSPSEAEVINFMAKINREIKTLRMLLFVVRVVVFGIFAVLTGKVVVDDCTVVMLRFCKVLM